MRIDPSQVLVQSGLKFSPEKGSFTDTLNVGDRLEATVLSSGDNGAVVMQTDDGNTFNARLDADAMPFPGDKLLLEVAGREDGNIVLTIVGDGSADGGNDHLLKLVRDFDDKSLIHMAAKLSQLNLPVSEPTARAMYEMLQQNPGMTMDEAAFIAANRLAGDEGLVKAALALLADGAKTDAIIDRLLTLLSAPETAGTPSAQSSGPHSGGQIPAPLTDWLTQISQGAAETGSSITQTDTDLQSTITANITNNSTNITFSADLPLSEQQNSVPEQGLGGGSPLHGPAQSPTPAPSNSTLNFPIAAPGSPDAQLPAPNSNTAAAVDDAGKMIAGAISEIPEFRGTPPEAIERFANMLVRVAGDSADISGGDSEKLKALLENLFTRIERSGEGAGERVRAAKEELFARLALIEEAISRASPPAKAEMLQQTRGLMDHVRLLNNIGQFAYMQIPVKMGGDGKTAELYLFKRKGGRKPDPENVNILLAIDLQHMGRWEALLNIRGKDVSIQMEVRGPEEKDFISEHTVLLYNMLGEAGFKLVGTGITYSEKETTPLTALITLDRYTDGKGASVDFKI